MTREIMGWDPDERLLVPDGVDDHFTRSSAGARRTAPGRRASDSWRGSHAKPPRSGTRRGARRAAAAGPRRGAADSLSDDEDRHPQRGPEGHGGDEPFTPTMVGGAADLSESTKTLFPQPHSPPGRG